MSKSVSTRPFNSYNLFYILERELILQSSGVNSRQYDTASNTSSRVGFHNYIDLLDQFPRIPARVLPNDWFMHGKDKKGRSHSKSHGLLSLKEMSQIVSSNWKSLGENDEILSFVRTVAKLVKNRRDELALSIARCQMALTKTVASSTKESSTRVTNEKFVLSSKSRYLTEMALSDHSTTQLLATPVSRHSSEFAESSKSYVHTSSMRFCHVNGSGSGQQFPYCRLIPDPLPTSSSESVGREMDISYSNTEVEMLLYMLF
eukprot:scaffold1664_cov193-Alexandrium_tamarense.AAC.3